MLRDFVRRWLFGNELADRAEAEAGLRRDIDRIGSAVSQVIVQLNRNTRAIDFHDTVLNATPSTARIKRSILAKHAREEKRLATPAVTGAEPVDRGEGAESEDEMTERRLRIERHAPEPPAA